MDDQQRKILFIGNQGKWQHGLKKVWAAYNGVPEEDKTTEVFYYRIRNSEGNIFRTHVRTLPFHRFFVEFIALVEHQRQNEVYSSRERADLEDNLDHPITSSTLRRPYSTVPADVEADRFEILVGVSTQMRDVYDYYRRSTSGTQWTPLPVAGVGRGRGSASVATTSASTASTTTKPSTVSKPPSAASGSTLPTSGPLASGSVLSMTETGTIPTTTTTVTTTAPTAHTYLFSSAIVAKNVQIIKPAKQTDPKHSSTGFSSATGPRGMPRGPKQKVWAKPVTPSATLLPPIRLSFSSAPKQTYSLKKPTASVPTTTSSSSSSTSDEPSVTAGITGSTTVSTTALATPPTYLSSGKLSSTLNLITPDGQKEPLKDLSVGSSGGTSPPPAKKQKGLSPPVTSSGPTVPTTTARGIGRAIAPNLQWLDIQTTQAPVEAKPRTNVIEVKKYGVTDLPKGKGFKLWIMPTETGTTGTTTPTTSTVSKPSAPSSGSTMTTTHASGMMLGAPTRPTVPTTTAQSLSSTSGPSVTSAPPRLTTTLTEVYDDQSSASDSSSPKMGENVAYDDPDDHLYDD